jgi:tetratricopeptide (TPR) repeat protein
LDGEAYHRTIREAFDLAFKKGRLEAGAARYAEAFATHAPGEVGYSHYHSEYAAVLHKLGREEEALTHRRLAFQAATQEYPGEPDASGVVIERYSLGEQLLAMGRSLEALEVIGPSVATLTFAAAPLLTVQAMAQASLGRDSEARASAAEAMKRATARQRANIEERLASILGQP